VFIIGTIRTTELSEKSNISPWMKSPVSAAIENCCTRNVERTAFLSCCGVIAKNAVSRPGGLADDAERGVVGDRVDRLAAVTVLKGGDEKGAGVAKEAVDRRSEVDIDQ
jgi:hypothetical protein